MTTQAALESVNCGLIVKPSATKNALLFSRSLTGRLMKVFVGIGRDGVGELRLKILLEERHRFHPCVLGLFRCIVRAGGIGEGMPDAWIDVNFIRDAESIQ